MKEARDRDPQALKARGTEAFMKEDFKTACDLYSKAIECCSEEFVDLLGALYSNRSACHLQLHHLEQALKDAVETIRVRPTWARGYLRKALALSCEGDVRGASDCVKEGLEKDPGDEGLVSLASDLQEAARAKRRKVEDGVEDEGVIKEAVEMLEAAGISGSIPVTVLSGFLGAGKTTLLKRILSEEHGKRIAVIVNDMADVNIDAELIRKNDMRHGISRSEEEIIEMSNGCVCCTLRGDLIKEASRLVALQAFDLLLIESSGISEPMPVAATFTTEDASGSTLQKYFTIDNMLTVVDAHRFAHDLKCGESLKDRKMEAFETDERTLSHLLMDQIEFASTILLNKCDLVTKDTADKLEKFIKECNANAQIVRTERCQAPIDKILDTKRFDLEAAHQAPGFDTELKTNHTPETEEYGIRSMFYKATRPFHPQRLFDIIYSGVNGETVNTIGPASFLNNILRSKGFFFLAHNMDTCFEWSTAGRSCNNGISGSWLSSTLPKENWPLNNPGWTPEFGDRRQGIVFIGEDLDVGFVQSKLDSCLLTDQELAAGESTWKNYGGGELWEIEDNEDNEDNEDESDESSSQLEEESGEEDSLEEISS